MKQIQLILGDFDQYCGAWRESQFTRNRDCPIARAVGRRFPEMKVYVMTFKVTVGDKDYYFKKDEGSSKSLSEKFLRLKEGKTKYAIVKLA